MNGSVEARLESGALGCWPEQPAMAASATRTSATWNRLNMGIAPGAPRGRDGVPTGRPARPPSRADSLRAWRWFDCDCGCRRGSLAQRHRPRGRADAALYCVAVKGLARVLGVAAT